MEQIKINIWCASGSEEIVRTVNYNIITQFDNVVEVIEIEKPSLPDDVDDFEEDFKWQFKDATGLQILEINYL
jgi:hypothetical protein